MVDDTLHTLRNVPQKNRQKNRRGRLVFLGDCFSAIGPDLHRDDASNADVAEGTNNVSGRRSPDNLYLK